MADKDTLKEQASISLVTPSVLALRLAYLISIHPEKGIFFKTTRKRLEKLAKYKEMADQAVCASNNAMLDKAPVTEAYLDCCRHELERLGFTLIKADKEYLACAAADLHKVIWIGHDHTKFQSLADSALKAEVDDFLANRQKTTKAPSKDKADTDDRQLVLQDIWAKLIDHVKANSGQSELPTLTYQELTSKLDYKVYRNGLGSFLFSIEPYCIAKGLPKLNYLVVKEGTKLPDGLKNTDSKAIAGFNNELEEIAEFVKNNEFPESPDIKYQKKDRAKKSRQSVTEKAYSDLDV